MSMNKRERVEATLNGKPVDRPPVSFWTHFGNIDHQAKPLARAMIDWQEEFDLDFVKLMPSGMYCVEDWGVKVSDPHPLVGNKTLVESPVTGLQDWEALQPLDTGSGALARELSCLRQVRTALGNEVHILQTVFSPLTIAVKLSSPERVLELLRNHPGTLHTALRTITETFKVFVSECLANGADGIFLATQMAAQGMATASEYQTFGLPYDQELLAAADGTFTMLHCHGQGVPLEIFADSNAASINWESAAVRPRDVYARVSKPIIGGMDQLEFLRKASAQEVRQAVLTLVAESEGLPHMVSPGCVLFQDTPRENLRAMRDALDK